VIYRTASLLVILNDLKVVAVTGATFYRANYFEI